MLNREKLIKKALFKLLSEEKIKETEIFRLLKKNKILDDEDIDQDKLDKKVKISTPYHELLRKIYEQGDIKQLYTYSKNNFGFKLDKFRFDVNLDKVEIKKL